MLPVEVVPPSPIPPRAYVGSAPVYRPGLSDLGPGPSCVGCDRSLIAGDLPRAKEDGASAATGQPAVRREVDAHRHRRQPHEAPDSPTVLRPSCAVGANVGHARRAYAAGGMVVVGGKVEAGGTVAVCTGATSFGMRTHKIG
jgi:hypothetical protein